MEARALNTYDDAADDYELGNCYDLMDKRHQRDFTRSPFSNGWRGAVAAAMLLLSDCGGGWMVGK